MNLRVYKWTLDKQCPIVVTADKWLARQLYCVSVVLSLRWGSLGSATIGALGFLVSVYLFKEWAPKLK
jgi:hypothetical protein